MNMLYNRKARFLLIVILPFSFVAAHVLFSATERFESETTIIVKDNSSGNNNSLEISTLLGPNPTSSQDTQILKDYIRSHDMLAILRQSIPLYEHYSSADADWLSRLDNDASQEEFLEHYRQRISVTYDDQSHSLTLKTQAYSREFATELAELILKESETFINSISENLAKEQYEFLKKEVQKVAGELAEKRRKILQFQTENNLVSPDQEGAVVSGILASLEAQLTEAEAELRSLQGYLRPNAPEVRTARIKTNALRAQLKAERSRLIGTDDKALNQVMAKFQDMNTEFELSSQVYSSTLAALQEAQFEATRQLKYLVRISGPSIPDEAAYPNTSYILITTGVTTLLLYWILSMFTAILKEHSE